MKRHPGTVVLSFTPPLLATSGRPDGPLGGWVVEPTTDGWRTHEAVDGDGLQELTWRGRGHHGERAGRDDTSTLSVGSFFEKRGCAG